MTKEMDNILEKQKRKAYDNPNAYKADLVGSSDHELYCEKEYLDEQLSKCVEDDEKYYKAKLEIVKYLIYKRMEYRNA